MTAILITISYDPGSKSSLHTPDPGDSERKRAGSPLPSPGTSKHRREVILIHSVEDDLLIKLLSGDQCCKQHQWRGCQGVWWWWSQKVKSSIQLHYLKPSLSFLHCNLPQGARRVVDGVWPMICLKCILGVLYFPHAWHIFGCPFVM